jgi:ubiquinone/menaquinone biosynthesis C-methylase UbiE
MSSQSDLPSDSPPLSRFDDHSEAARQFVMQHWLHETLDGLLPEQPDLSTVYNVLDVACGAGAWAVELARAFPHLRVTGVDHRPQLLNYARALAQEQGLTNATFTVGNLREDEQEGEQEGEHAARAFPSPGAFDLVHLAYSATWMRHADYPALLQRLWRLCCPGGILRWTESDMPATTSPALAVLASLMSRAAHIELPCEHRFTVIHLMGRWLRDAGFGQIRSAASVLEVSVDTPAHASFFRQVWMLIHQAGPFLLEQGVITSEALEALFEQVQHELHEPSFCALCLLVTVQGEKDHDERKAGARACS